MKEVFLFVGPGASDQNEVVQLSLGEGSINLYPTDEGEYLQNYPGRTDVFRRLESYPKHLGTPPDTDTKITRIVSFRDYRTKEHIVFVRGLELCEKYGNGYRVLYTFKGETSRDLIFPTIFIHEAKLIIVNYGDPVLMWDGVEKVHPMGVQEIPFPPDVRVSLIPGGDFSEAPPGIFTWRCAWWTGKNPPSGPAEALGADDSTPVKWYGEVVIQFVDKYGNKGTVSPPSRVFEVLPGYFIEGLVEGIEPWKLYQYVAIDYYPPMKEDHIHAVLVGRTLNLNPDGGRGVRGLYYLEDTRMCTAYNRLTCQLTDTQLSANGEIDSLVRGPPQARYGCSAMGRVWLWGTEEAHVVWYSDIGYFGQFRINYQASDHVRAVVGLSERVAIITRSTVEILYSLNDGSIARLSQDFANGSDYGRSFVDAGNGSIFGLWNRGFGFYDGNVHEYVETPYYISERYLDNQFTLHSAIKVNQWYHLTVRRNMDSSGNNVILRFHLQTRQWFVLEESVYDICAYRGAYLGCDDSIYQLFRGIPAESKLWIRSFLPPGASPLEQRKVNALRIFMQASSKEQASVEIRGEHLSDKSKSWFGALMPRVAGGGNDPRLVPYWNQQHLRYQDSNTPPLWVAPGDFWLTPGLDRSVSGYKHSFLVTFPAGHMIKVKALGVTYDGEFRSVTS